MVKRFVNADSASLVTANSYGLTDKNLFSYCDNSPVSRRDDGGELWGELLTGVAVVAGITAVCALAVATAGISVSAVAVAGGGMALSASTTSTSLAALGVAGASMVISAASVYFAKKQKGIVHMTLIHIKGLIRKSKGEKEKTKIVKRRITNRGTIGEITSPQSLSIIRQPKNIRNSRRVRMGGENEYLDDDSVEKVHRRRCVRTPFGTAYAV